MIAFNMIAAGEKSSEAKIAVMIDGLKPDTNAAPLLSCATGTYELNLHFRLDMQIRCCNQPKTLENSKYQNVFICSSTSLLCGTFNVAHQLS